jgi:hypothetical protein
MMRWLLVAGAMAIRYARQHGTKRPWLMRLMDRRPIKVAAVALANKIARMARAQRRNADTVVPGIRRARLGHRIFECVRTIGT